MRELALRNELALWNEFVFIGYEALTVLLPCMIVYMVYAKVYGKEQVYGTKKRLLGVLVFAVYILAVFNVTGLGTLFELLRYGLEMRPDQINIVPFSDGIGISTVLNVVLFVPLGFLLPLLWPKMNKTSLVLLTSFSFSLLIEVTQLFNHRSTDIDDLIVNTLGSLVGYVLFRLYYRIKKRPKHEGTQPDRFTSEPFVYLSAMFIGHFCLFNGMALASIVYGKLIEM